MTQEEKSLLLQDLCTRLPYGVYCCVLKFDKTIKEDNDIIYGIIGDNIVTLKSDKDECYMYYQVKPYLRPMSSMTEEERDEFEDESNGWFFINEDGEIYPFGRLTNSEQFECGILSGFKYLLKNHLDYHNLISRGLALEAPEGMYKTEQI